jgi:hypothetical protein
VDQKRSSPNIGLSDCLLNNGAKKGSSFGLPASSARPSSLAGAPHLQLLFIESNLNLIQRFTSIPSPFPLLPPPQPLTDCPIPALDPHRHLELVKGVLHHVVRVAFVHALHDGIDVWHERVGDEQEFAAGVGLEAAHAEEGGFERFNAGDGEVGVGGCEGGGGGRGGFVVERSEVAGVGVAVGSAGGRGFADGDSRGK